MLALLQSLRPWAPDGPTVGFGTADAVLSLYTASGWISAALLGASACSLGDSDPGFIRRLAFAVTGTALLLAVVGLVQMAEGNAAIYGIRVVMSAVYPFAGFYNRNHAACFLGVGAILAVGLYREYLPAGASVDVWAKRLTLAFPLLILVGAIWATESRGAIAILLMVGVLLFRSSLLLFLGIASAAVGWAIVHSSLSIRADIYRSTLVAIWDRWPYGWGAGSFAVASPIYMSRAIGLRVPHAHADWLQLAMEFGVLLGIFVLAVVSVVFVRVTRSSNGLRRAFVSAAAFVILHAAVEAPLFAGVNIAALALCCAIFQGHEFGFPNWTKAVPFAAAIYVAIACSWTALDSFGRLTTEAYFAANAVADDRIKNIGGREILSRYADPWAGVWDGGRHDLLARALSEFGRTKDANDELRRRNTLLDLP
jgi:hypothetical protein